MTAGSDKKGEEGKEDQENTSTSLSEDAARAKNKIDIDSIKRNSGDNSDDDSDDSEEEEVLGPRCRTGSAVITGPGDYGALRVPYVIHAVGPNFWDWLGREREGFARLQSAYAQSLHLAAQHNIHHVAFSLLSAGIFSGRQPLARVLAYGIRAVAEWRAVDPNDIDGSSSKASDQCSVQKVYFCAFTERECLCLLKAGRFVMEQQN